MAAVFGNLYDALREAGVNDDRARKAAEELFEQTSEVGVMRASIVRLETDVSAIKADVTATKRDVSELKASYAVIRWMLGFNLAMTLTLLWKAFLGH